MRHMTQRVQHNISKYLESSLMNMMDRKTQRKIFTTKKKSNNKTSSQPPIIVIRQKFQANYNKIFTQRLVRPRHRHRGHQNAVKHEQ